MDNSYNIPLPRLNQDVMEIIFNYLNYSDLKSSRQVCKLWNSLLFPSFRKKTTVSTNFNSTSRLLSEFVRIFSNKYGIEDQEIHQVYSTFYLSDQRALAVPIFQTWMFEYGHNITKLTLMIRKTFEFNIITAVEGILIENKCPNLKEFRFYFGMLHYLAHDEVVAPEYLSTEKNFQILRTLKIGKTNLPSTVMKYGIPILKMINTVEDVKIRGWDYQRHIIEFYKFLNSEQENPGKSSVLQSIKNLDIHFKELCLETFNHLVSVTFINLNHLEIKLPSTWSSLSNALPTMPSLKILIIMADNLINLDFLLELKKLISFTTYSKKTMEREMNDVVGKLDQNQSNKKLEKQSHTNLKYFKFIHSNLITILTMANLKKWFPNLKSITTTYSYNQVHVAMQQSSQFKGIQELEIIILRPTNEFFVSLLKCLPQFTALKTLTIRCRDMSLNFLPINEDVVRDGFFKVPNLCRLRLYGFNMLQHVKILLLAGTHKLRVYCDQPYTSDTKKALIYLGWNDSGVLNNVYQ